MARSFGLTSRLAALLGRKPEPVAADFSRDTHPETDRAERRAYLAKYVEPGGIGAEIGVFWAHFSQVLLREFNPSKLYLVDPWSKMHGETFRNWGAYTDHGRLQTVDARAAAEALADAYPDVVEVHEKFSIGFMKEMPDRYFDWVYLDARHSYEAVTKDLAAILPKMKTTGVILGDDYYTDPDNKHAGVKQAVDAFAQAQGWTLTTGPVNQYILRQTTEPT